MMTENEIFVYMIATLMIGISVGSLFVTPYGWITIGLLSMFGVFLNALIGLIRKV